MSGRTRRVASASRQSRMKSTIAVPRRTSAVLDEARDAVRQELVERLDVVRDPADDRAGPVPLEEAERQALEVAEEPDAQIRERALADPAREVRLERRERERGEAGGHERDDDDGERLEILCEDAVVDRDLRQVRRQQARPACTPTSVTTASAVRPGYGRASRASMPSRRRVCAHDQSSTCAERWSVRWLPACQTFNFRPSVGAPRPTTHCEHNGEIRTRGTRIRGECVPIRGARRALDRGRAHPANHLLEQPVLVDLAEERALLEQLVARPARGDPPVLEHDDLVGERDRRQPVRDDDRRPPAHDLAQPGADLRLGRRVDRRGRVVEDEDSRIDEQRARDRDPLSLPARERDPALADDRVVAVRQLLDELVRLRRARGRLDGLVPARPAARTRCCRAPTRRTGTDPAR